MPDKQKQTLPILPESELRTLFVDNLAMSTRADGMHLLSFYATLPNGWSEQARVIVSDQHLSQMLEVLTKHCKSWQGNPEPADAAKK